MSNRVRLNSKNDVQTSQKMLPMKAIHLFETSGGQKTESARNLHSSNNKLSPLSSNNRGFLYEQFVSGHRSPGAGAMHYKVKNIHQDSSSIRRTASLDALYKHPCPLSWNIGPQSLCTFINVDKATQTDESFIEKLKGGPGALLLSSPINSEFKMEKVIRQRMQRNAHRSGENSVSSQTLSPVHAKASPVLIPSPRTCLSSHMRPMRSSVEGLNQEIEKLVLYNMSAGTSGSVTGRSSECDLLTRFTPDRHRSHYCDLFNTNTCASAGYFTGNQVSATEFNSNMHNLDTRSVNTQTPIFDNLLSDESQSTSPDDETGSGIGASPRINKFLAREPPDGCEKVNMKMDRMEDAISLEKPKLFTPQIGGFQLKPSLGSAFLPLRRLNVSKKSEDEDDCSEEGAVGET